MLSESLLIQFTRNLQGKNVDALIRAAKTESENRMVGQGLAQVAYDQHFPDIEPTLKWRTPENVAE